METDHMTREELVQRVRQLEAEVRDMQRMGDTMRTQEEKYTMAFEHTGTAMLILEEDMTVSDGNHKMQLMTGYSQDEIERKIAFPKYVAAEDRERMVDYFNRRRRGEPDIPNEYEFKLLQKDGGTRDILINVSMVPQTKKSLVSLIDITERKRMEKALLAQARKETEDAKRVIQNLRKEIRESSQFGTMVSRSPLMREIFDMLPEVARSPATVLVTGESGTGKELIARALHDLSGRKDKPFVAVNCSALPDTLLESELFGYKAGAFTDAKKDKPGVFDRAHGGTIFLDEIGDVSGPMQARLLRVLQDRTFVPLGAAQPVTVDVRIVAATNKDLAAAVKSGEFRQDLLYRINVLVIKLPPLHDRRCDIPLLCDYFIERFNARYNKEIKGISQDAMDACLKYDFPGNIRELENVIEHAFIFCKDPVIGCEHLPQQVRGGGLPHVVRALSTISDFTELERVYLEAVLAETGGNRLRAAQKLGIHKATLFRKLKKLGIEAKTRANA
jgi:PAS domain S-box-containing protein